MTDYSGERGEPKVPTCRPSGLLLLFDGRYLRMQAKGGELILYSAVSGKKKDGSFHYGVERQQLKSKGPIPEGKYWINPSELWTRGWKTDLLLGIQAATSEHSYDTLSEAFDASWGESRLTIHPYPDTETHGRGGFFIHGGEDPGSAGCIDLTTEMQDFVTQLKKRVGKNEDCYVPMTVKYSGEGAAVKGS